MPLSFDPLSASKLLQSYVTLQRPDQNDDADDYEDDNLPVYDSSPVDCVPTPMGKIKIIALDVVALLVRASLPCIDVN